jgi:hypothetical protein
MAWPFLGAGEVTDEELEQRLKVLVTGRAGWRPVHQVLSEFALSGGSQIRAQGVLEKMLQEAENEGVDDAIRDALDIATGWCAPNLRVWP